MAKMNPEDVDWLNHYYQEGLVHLKAGRLSVAEEIFASILVGLPQHLGARFHLGCVLMQVRDYKAALREFARATTDFPDHAESYTNLGTCYLELGRLEAAYGAYEAALALAEDDTQALFNVGVLQRMLGNPEAAIATYQRLLALEPTHVDAHVNLGAIYMTKREPEAALRHYREANRLRPNDPVIEHALKLAKGEPGLTAMAPAYARALFDGVAPSYDHALLNGLHYQVPAKVAEVLVREPSRSLRILDLGCGTGLCGEVLRPFASTLTGVDISPKMLEVAKAKGLYDALHEAALEDYLTSVTEAFDVVVAGDVFVYIGELHPVLLGCYYALSPEGRLVFTVETGKTGEQTYALQETGRFWHDLEALSAAAKVCGFRVLTQTPVILREQAGVPVPGSLCVWQKIVQ